jgi:hypothetical protein
MLMSDEASIKAIQQRMQQVRHDLGDEVGELVESAKDMTDWRKYVRANPWVCLAAAAAIGYVVVPKRSPRFRLNSSDLKELARHTNVVQASVSKKDGGWRKTVLSLVTSAAMRAAMSYLKQHAVKAATQPMEEARAPRQM